MAVQKPNPAECRRKMTPKTATKLTRNDPKNITQDSVDTLFDLSLNYMLSNFIAESKSRNILLYLSPGKGGGGGTPLYGLYRYVQPQRVGFFSRFGHK